MWQKRPWTFGWKAVLVVALIGCGASGCGDGPTSLQNTSLSDLFGDQLYRADGSPVGVEALDQTSIIGVYFASPGCPACGAFNPLLIDAYDQLRADGRSFDVVLVTVGISATSQSEYMVDSGMPWLAVSAQSKKPSELAQRYLVRWVPTLIVIDGNLNVVSFSGRDELTQGGPAVYDAWLATSSGS